MQQNKGKRHQMDTGNTSRGSFGSQLGVILASAGSAVGLGNIWRFPTEVGRGGGAAFILIYLGFIFLLALPVMLCEFIIGRSARSNAIGAFQKLAPGKPWIVAGIMGVLGGFLVIGLMTDKTLYRPSNQIHTTCVYLMSCCLTSTDSQLEPK